MSYERPYNVNGKKLTPGIRITYIPNPKRPGSMAHARYEKYQKAKTFGQYLKLNQGEYAMPDARWDLERGFLIILREKTFASDRKPLKGAPTKLATIEKQKKTGPSGLKEHLDTFPNPAADRDFTVRIDIPEFTCLCPKTGQPDFAVLQLEYVPNTRCVELKSLKLYIAAYRDHGVFHEAVTNSILDDLVALTEPRFMRLTGKFNVRGGICTTVIAEHRRHDWQAPPVVNLP